MNDVETALTRSLEGLDDTTWLREFVNIVDEHGAFQPLGKRHFAALVENGSTLLVTFESLPAIRTQGEPLGWHMVRDSGWSHLCLACDGDTWFRDPRVFGYFDRLVDDGFLEDFETVLFYGAGPCGYAAAAFSVTAPGARVLTISPQATLDPEHALWDNRFTEMRRVSFTDRYGFAPDMTEAADQAFVIYDPTETLDAMHAALFRRKNTTALKLRRMGDAIEGDLKAMQILHRLIELAGTGRLNAASFARLARTRRSHLPYLRRLLGAIEAAGRPTLVAALCRNVVARMKAPRFARRLEMLTSAEGAASGETHPDKDATEPARVG
ncbi:phosphoadenosine phosphosulfate reductase [Pseudooceanicola sp.]|uniref:phosphoadenosine phosphosulfate reductase n=1 Tax=Pseudooceanicola sp. TaxID=1914328 RepID=UPI002604DB52|nr:phosphoadenosine phosphosulfate reductase [Pseudooceanicola sp.]MDF1855601.1 phosphoadenosine phosphosulfate reductase [Pseudooceanicola sp.]